MPAADVTTYYLEMLARPAGPIPPPPRDGLLVLHAKRPSVAYYRFLYHTVGSAYHWHSRGKLPDDRLAAAVQHPLIEILVLHADGCPAGFAELSHRVEGEVEIVQFGLMPEFIGQGLGKYFLRWVIGHVWDGNPRRLWLHTCTQDHPAALPNYLKAGFTLYREEVTRRNAEP